MQFGAVTLLALSTVALAAVEKRQATGLDEASVRGVLITALPPSLLAVAATNPAAVSSEIAAEFSASGAPSWFTALPTDVQSYLLGAPAVGATPTASNGIPTNSANMTMPTGAGVINGTIGGIAGGNGTTGVNGTTGANGATDGSTTSAAGLSTVASVPGRSSSAASTRTGASSSAGSPSGSAGAAGSSSPASTGGAALPTAVIGAGIAGVVGFVGMLAL
ncbi:hypothetical protein LTS18_008579 [Coniosporium uncinatum]|uniref:Uncharacterized protein n=1 Tax=Coniosporium uncinatum TaxID=93489 RepID=A0ACC3D1C6_9PEZI|nr:hypothetical protein LTS18_008579 [Coniosporium uncinatum]